MTFSLRMLRRGSADFLYWVLICRNSLFFFPELWWFETKLCVHTLVSVCGASSCYSMLWESWLLLVFLCRSCVSFFASWAPQNATETTVSQKLRLNWNQSRFLHQFTTDLPTCWIVFINPSSGFILLSVKLLLYLKSKWMLDVMEAASEAGGR